VPPDKPGVGDSWTRGHIWAGKNHTLKDFLRGCVVRSKIVLSGLDLHIKDAGHRLTALQSDLADPAASPEIIILILVLNSHTSGSDK
jgi:hypothetical protein